MQFLILLKKSLSMQMLFVFNFNFKKRLLSQSDQIIQIQQLSIQYTSSSMIKRLKLFQSQVQKELQYCGVDRTHNKIKFTAMRRIYLGIQVPKYRRQLLQILKKNIHSSSNTLKIKSLIVVHYLIRKSFSPEIMNFAEQQLTILQENNLKNKKISDLNDKKMSEKDLKKKIITEEKEYIQSNIIDFYSLYLRKFIAYEESYNFALKNLKKQSSQTKNSQPDYKILETTCQTKVQGRNVSSDKRDKQDQLLIQINHGFQIINLINFILQSQQSFNKMGRYFIEHDQILNLFIMYLDDLTIYNDYVKKLAKQTTNQIHFLKEEQVKHCYLFLTESQKSSDRLYQFFYNRYYYSKVKKLIYLPTFLTVQNDQFERVVKQVKRIDKQLFLAVRQSKYSEEYNKMNRTMSYSTQTQDSCKRSKYDKLNRTVTQMDKRHKTLTESQKKKVVEESILEYIQCINDIDDDIQIQI